MSRFIIMPSIKTFDLIPIDRENTKRVISKREIFSKREILFLHHLFLHHKSTNKKYMLVSRPT